MDKRRLEVRAFASPLSFEVEIAKNATGVFGASVFFVGDSSHLKSSRW
jgi:hypothetical protein